MDTFASVSCLNQATYPLQKKDEEAQMPKRSRNADRKRYMNVPKPLPEPVPGTSSDTGTRRGVKRPVEIPEGEATPALKRLVIQELVKQGKVVVKRKK